MAANAQTLMNQAPMTADKYLGDVVRSIDERFGDGFAKANPTLVAAMLQTCAMDFAACMLSNSLTDVADTIEAGFGNMG